MAVTDDRPPPTPGDWRRTTLANSGNWSVGPVWLDRAAGRYGLWIGPDHCNAFDVMHGGAMATFADAQVVAVRDYVEGVTRHTPTVTLGVDYLAPAPVGSWLVMTAALLRETRTLLYTQGLVTIGDEPVARTSAIYRNYQERA